MVANHHGVVFDDPRAFCLIQLRKVRRVSGAMPRDATGAMPRARLDCSDRRVTTDALLLFLTNFSCTPARLVARAVPRRRLRARWRADAASEARQKMHTAQGAALRSASVWRERGACVVSISSPPYVSPR